MLPKASTFALMYLGIGFDRAVFWGLDASPTGYAIILALCLSAVFGVVSWRTPG